LKGDRSFSASFYAASSRGPAELEKALDVDGVTSLDITEIPFGHIGRAAKDEEAEAGEGASPSAFTYSRGERKSVFLYQDELALHAFLSAALATGVREDARQTLLAHALAAALRRHSGASLALVLEKAARMANDTATRLGKMLEVEVRMDEDIPVLPSVRDALGAILTHLVRNAVDHGIETPEKRRAEGKLEWGRLFLEAKIKNGTYTIKVADDGAGISADEIRKSAGSAKNSGKSGGVLEILTSPGFSTRREASPVSGRGVGLDVVRSLVTGSLGGKLTLETQPGKGAVFTVSFSDRTVRYPAFPARVEGKLLLVPKLMTERIFPFNEQKLSGAKKFFYTLEGASYPALLFAGQTRIHGDVGILVRGLESVFMVAAQAVEEEKMYRLADLIPSVCVLLARDS
jgi:two-component sensor histidine kinase